MERSTNKVHTVVAFILSLAFCASSFAIAPRVYAVTTEDLQKQIESLMQTIFALKTQLATMKGESTSQSCVNVTRTLYIGLSDRETGAEVTALQKFLGMNPTGFFGPLTQQKVQAWQAQKGIVSSGDPDTTGYGLVGQRTRAEMSSRCRDGSVASSGVNTPSEVPTPVIDFAVAPLSTIKPGQNVTLSWSVKNAMRCVLQYDSKEVTDIDLKDSITLSPTKTTLYRLWCANDSGTGKDGPSQEQTITVHVSDHAVLAPTCVISATSHNVSPYTVVPGALVVIPNGSATISWTSKNADYVVLNGEKANLNDSLSTGTLTDPSNSFTLTAHGANDVSQCSTIVYVEQKG